MDDHTQFFRMQEGETIIESVKPVPQFKTFLVAKWLPVLSPLLFIGIIVSLFKSKSTTILPIATTAYLATLVIVALSIYAVASLEYDKRHYWITNKRVIEKKGMFGYSIYSVPFERISDSMISRTFVEKLFGFGSLKIQSLAGQISLEKSSGSEIIFEAVQNPEALQEIIFNLTTSKRKKENLTI